MLTEIYPLPLPLHTTAWTGTLVKSGYKPGDAMFKLSYQIVAASFPKLRYVRTIFHDNL